MTATVRDPARHDAVAALGADVVLAPGDEAAQAPYDVVLELVGAPSLTNVAAAPGDVGPRRGDRRRRRGPHGDGAHGPHAEAGQHRRLHPACPQPAREGRRGGRRDGARPAGAGAGRLQIPVYETFPLAEAQAAYDHFAAGAKFGKVVLVAP